MNERLAERIRNGLPRAKGDPWPESLRGADLKGADLKGADLEFAKLDFANLSEANLAGANLRSASLIGASLRGADLSGTTLRRARGLSTNFEGANLTAANLEEAEFKDSRFTRANLNLANLTKAKVSDSDFEEANLFAAVFKEAAIDGNFNGANLSENDLSGGDCGGSFRQANLENAVLGSDRWAHIKGLYGDYRGANLRGVQFVHCILGILDMSGADLRGSNLRDVVHVHGDDSPEEIFKKHGRPNLSGANLAGLNLGRLEGLQLVGANLQGCKLRGSLRKTNLTGANLSGADLTGAVFDETNLSNADLSGVNLDDLNLEGAIFNAPAPDEGNSYRYYFWRHRDDHEDEPKWDSTTGLNLKSGLCSAMPGDLHWSVPFESRHEVLRPSEGGAATGRGEKDPNSKSPTHSPKNVACPKCDGHLEERSGRFGPFLGCTAYPKCRFTSSVKAKPAVSVEEDMVRWLRTQRDNSFARDLVKWFEEKGFLSKKQLAAAAKLRRDQVTQRHEADNGYEGRNETDDYYDYLREIAEDNGQSFGDFMDSVWRD